MKGGETKVTIDKATRRLVWILVATMTLSFVLGVSCFLPEEHRTAKLEEAMAKYQAKIRKP